MKTSYLFASLSLILMLAVGGCGKKPVAQVEAPPAPPAPEPAKVVVEKQPEPPAAIEKIIEAEEMKLDTILFDYNSAVLTATAREVLKSNLAWLQTHPAAKITIEGHCDERGSDEFNLALGERRALTVKSYFAGFGIAAERLDTISYGEERPVSSEHDEVAWSQNRRVEFR